MVKLTEYTLKNIYNLQKFDGNQRLLYFFFFAKNLRNSKNIIMKTQYNTIALPIVYVLYIYIGIIPKLYKL